MNIFEAERPASLAERFLASPRDGEASGGPAPSRARSSTIFSLSSAKSPPTPFCTAVPAPHIARRQGRHRGRRSGDRGHRRRRPLRGRDARAARRSTMRSSTRSRRRVGVSPSCAPRSTGPTIAPGRKNRFVGRRSLRRRRATALVVEDTPSLLDAYTEALQRDYRVIGCFVAAKRPSRRCGSTQIDVVLADVHLGDGLGVALPDEIASLDSGAASGRADQLRQFGRRRARRALRLGAEFYLSKPVRPQALRDAVALALSRAALREARLAGGSLAMSTVSSPAACRRRWPPTGSAIAAGTPSAGGGDLVLHLPQTGGDRIVLIDVIGHGVAARAWAVAYAAIVRTLHHCNGDLSAGAFLTELAQIAWSEPTLERALATVLVVDLDPEGASIASAGHPPPLVIGEQSVARARSIALARRAAARASPVGTDRARRRAIAWRCSPTGSIPQAWRPETIRPPWFMAAICEGTDRTARRRRRAGFRRRPSQALGPQPADDWTFILIERTAAP